MKFTQCWNKYYTYHLLKSMITAKMVCYNYKANYTE